MSRKINVAVLMGGKSSEHEISLMSGSEVVKNLDRKKYNIFPVNISRDGRNWLVAESEKFFLDPPAATRVRSDKSKVLSFGPDSGYPRLFKDKNIDLVFIALHGSYGEDGRIQGFLDLTGMSYTGSKVLASALALDKNYSRKLFTQVGLNVPKSKLAKKGKAIPKLDFDFSVFVKPNNQGSSIGVSRAKNKKELASALKKAHTYSNLAIIEEYLNGTEVTAAILGSEKLIPLPLVEIVPKKEFFDYEAKYNESLCDEIVPARISKGLTKKAQQAAILAYETLGCQGFGRVDMIIKNNKVYVLEVNSIPGLTPASLLPKAAKAAGLSYSNLLDKIIDYSLE